MLTTLVRRQQPCAPDLAHVCFELSVPERELGDRMGDIDPIPSTRQRGAEPLVDRVQELVERHTSAMGSEQVIARPLEIAKIARQLMREKPLDDPRLLLEFDKLRGLGPGSLRDATQHSRPRQRQVLATLPQRRHPKHETRHKYRARKAGSTRHTTRHPAQRKIKISVDSLPSPSSLRVRRSCTCRTRHKHAAHSRGRTRSGLASAAA
jgi:hypothetical protein